MRLYLAGANGGKSINRLFRARAGANQGGSFDQTASGGGQRADVMGVPERRGYV